MAGHSKLSPSSAERWVSCPGSIRLSVGLPPSPSSPAAAEGTATHTLSEELVTGVALEAELRTRVGQTMRTWDGFVVRVTSEMVDAAVLYRDTIKADLAAFNADGRSRSSPVVGKAEVEVTASSIDPELHGTSDYVAFRKGHRLIVTDLKYGKKSVNPEKNKQLTIYAVGAMDTLAGDVFDEVVLKVVQPRAGGTSVREWSAPLSYIKEFRAEMRAAVAATRDPKAPLKAGGWCFFCPAQAVCPEILAESEKQAQTSFSVIPAKASKGLPAVEQLPLDRVATALSWEGPLMNWFDALRARAKKEMESGVSVPNFKLVEGRSSREWVDPQAAADELLLTMKNDEVFTTPELKSPAQVEKVLGKGKVPTHLIHKKAGDLVVVPADDPRTEVTPQSENPFAAIETTLVGGDMSNDPLAGLLEAEAPVVDTDPLDELLGGPQPPKKVVVAKTASKTVPTIQDIEADILGGAEVMDPEKPKSPLWPK